MRGRAFVGVFIALCLIAGCSSSSSDDAALREALDRIESLEEELEEKATTTVPPTTAPVPTTTSTTTTTTTAPTYDLKGMIAALDSRVYDYLIDNPVDAGFGGDPYDESDWEEVLFYSGRPNFLEVEICYSGFLEGLVEWTFEQLLSEKLGLSKTLHIKILRDRTDDRNKVFEERQRGFHLEWMTERSAQRNCEQPFYGSAPWSTRIWITYEG